MSKPRGKSFKVLKRSADMYIAILLAILVSALSIFGVTDTKVVSTAILAILALICFTLSQERRHHDEVQKLISPLKLREYLANEVVRRDFDRILLKTHLARARKAAWFWGVSLFRTFLAVQDQVEAALLEGLQVRVLLQRSGSPSVRMAAYRSLRSNEEQINQQIDIVLSRLLAISSHVGPDLLHIRTIDYLPPYSVFIFDPEEGRSFIRLIPFRVPNDARPFFELSATSNPDLHRFFVEQFTRAWEAADTYPPLEQAGVSAKGA